MPTLFHAPADTTPAGAQHVFLAVPVGRAVDAAFLDFLWGTRGDLAAKGIAADLCLIEGNCHVDDVRNDLVAKFRQTTCTDLFFIDSDTVSSHDAVAGVLAHDRDVVAGVYPYKDDIEGYPVRLLRGQPIKAEDDGCVEVEMVPTGFLRIRRPVIEQIAQVVPGYFNKEVTRASGQPPIAQIFHREIDADGTRWGGDYNFCRKWRALGGKVYIDPALHFIHSGTKDWRGSIGIHWAKRFGTATPSFDKAVAAIRAGVADGAHFALMHVDWGNVYAAPPEMLAAAYMMALEADGPILETGSGLSTLLLGLAAEKTGVRVHALEHDPDYYRRTIAALRRYNLGSVRLHYAPLRNHGDCLWYEIPADLPDSFALVLCDGPQRRFGRRGLFGQLGSRIAGAKLIADDMDDAAERAWLEGWARSHGRTLDVLDTSSRPFGVSAPPLTKAA